MTRCATPGDGFQDEGAVALDALPVRLHFDLGQHSENSVPTSEPTTIGGIDSHSTRYKALPRTESRSA